MTDPRDLIQNMAEELDLYREIARENCWAGPTSTHPLANEARAYLAQPEPEGLTVEDCSNMPKHAGNYIVEDFGMITLDGCFTREDLIEIANTVPTTEA